MHVIIIILNMIGLSLRNELFHSDKKNNNGKVENIPIRIIFFMSISIPIPAIHFLLMYCLKKTCHQAAVSVSESVLTMMFKQLKTKHFTVRNLDFTIWQEDNKIASLNRDIVVNELLIYKELLLGHRMLIGKSGISFQVGDHKIGVPQSVCVFTCNFCQRQYSVW